MMAAILHDADEGQGDHVAWAARIRDRRHHRVIHETGEDANAMDLRHSGELLTALQAEFPKLDFYWDHASVSIHKLLVPEDSDAEGLVLLPLIGSGGERSFVGERSHILRRIPRRFQVARIFCDLDRDQKEFQAKLMAFASNEYRKLGGR